MNFGLFETHIETKDLDRAVEFYKGKLGLKLAHRNKSVAFFWLGQDKGQVLGVWLAENDTQVRKHHFAFKVDLEFLKGAKTWLADRGIAVIPVFGRGIEEPIVHTWVPAASWFFLDEDGNELEFLALLEGEPKKFTYTPYLSEWEAAR